VSWTALLLLAGCAYLLKACGPVLVGRRELNASVALVLGLLAVPLLAGLVVNGTLQAGHGISVDARVPALAVAALLVWRRAPFIVILTAAAATAALLRLGGLG
jgi:branched-subunit amino acid transport protein